MEGYLLAVGTIGGIYALLALGLNLQYGYTGLINFGVVALYAIGAYTSALLTMQGMPIALAMAAGTLLAAACAWPLGVICLRLRDDYLAIVTLAFAEIVRTVIVSEDWLTAGPRGLPGIPRPFASMTPEAAGVAYLCLVLAMVAICMGVTAGLVRSPFGRLIRAIRDDEDAVRSIGKSPARSKLVVFHDRGGHDGVGRGAVRALPDVHQPGPVRVAADVLRLDRGRHGRRRADRRRAGWRGPAHAVPGRIAVPAGCAAVHPGGENGQPAPGGHWVGADPVHHLPPRKAC